MPIRTYNCIISDFQSSTSSGIVKTIGVLRGADEPIIMKVASAQARRAFQFDSVSAGISISNGLYDRAITFFGRGSVRALDGAIERTDGSLFDFYYSSAFSVAFPGGCSFAIQSYNDGYYSTYATPHYSKTLSYSSREAAVGLMSDDVYTYEVTINNETITRSAIMYPVIYPFIAGVDDALKYCGSFVGLDSSSETWYYPTPCEHTDNAASVNQTERFEYLRDMMREFWRIVDANANSCHITTAMSNGGRVTPETSFAKINEPRMFTVTPDEHHAIHSVTAYNTLTNQQIPLQESGMDLLTGAKNYMFTMPAANVRIIVEFRSIEITIPVTVKYTSPRGKVFTTSFNLLYDDTEQREETAPPVEEQEGENQNE